MAERASQLLGLPFAFELSLVNVEKPSLEVSEVARRALAFRQRACLWLTRSPTYDAKAALFPGTVFVVGADTARRIVEPRFYAKAMEEALAFVRMQGCRFVVAGRVDVEGQFQTLADLPVPHEFAPLFTALPDFRLDLSSSELRRKEGGK
jgi:hypothetical protein